MVEVVYILWDDGIVVLKNEPFNVLGPQTLLLHWLGLEQKPLVTNPHAYVLKKHYCLYLFVYLNKTNIKSIAWMHYCHMFFCDSFHIYLDCMRLLGMLEMDDAEEEGIFGTVKEHQGGALQPQLM